jgi:hypothetical protein
LVKTIPKVLSIKINTINIDAKDLIVMLRRLKYYGKPRHDIPDILRLIHDFFQPVIIPPNLPKVSMVMKSQPRIWEERF